MCTLSHESIPLKRLTNVWAGVVKVTGLSGQVYETEPGEVFEPDPIDTDFLLSLKFESGGCCGSEKHLTSYFV